LGSNNLTHGFPSPTIALISSCKACTHLCGVTVMQPTVLADCAPLAWSGYIRNQIVDLFWGGMYNDRSLMLEASHSKSITGFNQTHNGSPRRVGRKGPYNG